MKDTTELENIKAQLWEQCCEHWEELRIQYWDDCDDGIGIVKIQYNLNEDEQAQELGYIDFADYIKEYIRETYMIEQPNWVTEWTRENLKAGVC